MLQLFFQQKLFISIYLQQIIIIIIKIINSYIIIKIINLFIIIIIIFRTIKQSHLSTKHFVVLKFIINSLILASTKMFTIRINQKLKLKYLQGIKKLKVMYDKLT